jgi:tight adherence protein C
MREICILAGFFLVVMATTCAAGYSVLFKDEKEEGENRLMETLRRIGTMAPLRPKESDRLRKRLVLAGYHSRSATTIFTGIRLAAAAALSLLVAGIALYAGQTLYKTVLLALCAALFGFALPTILLSRYIGRRSQRLRAGLPMALDLLVLALEAGQSLDAALTETSRQLREPFPDLNAEVMLVQLEIFAGKTRAEAFKNLALRSEEIEVRRLAQVFIDSDRFGTGLAPALRTHVHYLRWRMRQTAREKTRKVGVKLIFPLFFLIFPALLLVTLGPAILQVMFELRPLLANAVQ